MSDGPLVRLGRYRHYKGGEYQVLGIAQNTESMEVLVIYRSLSDERWWARPWSTFTGTVTVDDEPEPVPRFTFLNS